MSDAVLIVQLPRGGEVDRNWAEEMPPSIADGLAVVDYLPAEPGGSLGPPPAGEVVMSVLSPEALRDEPRIANVLREARHIESAVLHADIHVIGKGRGVDAALRMGQHMATVRTVIVDRDILLQEFDAAIDTRYHDGPP